MIIDFRLRPPTSEVQKAGLYSQRSAGGMHKMLGLPSPKSITEASPEVLIEEMKEAGITTGVIAALKSAGGVGGITSDHVAEMVKKYPQHFIGFAPIDPSDPQAAVKEIERSVKELGLKGVAMDPGCANFEGKDRLKFNDPDLYFIYKKCEELQIPVVLRTGPLIGRDTSWTSPIYIEEVAHDFPRLPIIAGHGCWPYVLEICAVAWKYRNVYVSPDLMINFKFPGYEQYVQGANTLFPRQMLFGSAYPFGPLKPSVDGFKSLALKPDVMEKALYENAAKLLKLG